MNLLDNSIVIYAFFSYNLSETEHTTLIGSGSLDRN